MDEDRPRVTLDVGAEECPLNWVRVKLRLEAMADGEVLEAIVADGAPAMNVPRSAREEGHEVLRVSAPVHGRVRVLLRKREVSGGP